MLTPGLTAQWNRLSRYSFSIVSILGFGITFIQNFIFAAILDKETFGRIFLISTLFSTFSYLSVFGLDTSIFKYYFDKKFGDKKDLRLAIFLSWLSLSSGLFVILLAVGFIVINYFGFGLLSFNGDYILLLISGILFSFFLIFQQYFIASKQLTFYFLSSFGVRLIILAFNMGSILFFDASISSFVKGYFISTLLLFIVAAYSFGFFRFRQTLPKGSMAEMFSFSTPLIFNGVISISFTNGYRILLSSLVPFGGLAVFGIISQISSAYYIGLSSLILPHNATAYRYMEIGKSRDVREIPFYKGKILQFALVGLLAILAISFCLLLFFKSGLYFEGFKMLPVLLAGQFFFLLYAHEHIVLSFWKKTSRITYSTIIGIIVMLTAFYPLVSWLGLWGACIVSFLGYLFQYLAAVIFKRNV